MCLVVFNFIQNNFVRLYCDSCHISMHFKKTYQIGESLCSHFNIKMEENTHFWHIMLLRKVKMQLKHKKRFVQCMEKVL